MTELDMDKKPKVGFIGAGTAGKALAVGLYRAGYRVVAASSRTFSSAEALAARVPGCAACLSPQEVADAADMVFVTTPDSVVSSVAASVGWHAGQWVVHCSGAYSLDLLATAEKQGAQVGSFHPLLTFGTVEQAIRSLPGTTFSLEGSGELLRALEEMALCLGGTSIRLTPGDRPLYHAAAVLSCGYVAVLLHHAVSLWQELGISREVTLKALAHLSRATVENVSTVGPERAVTGPIIRGDMGTVHRHLDALNKMVPHLVPLYCHMGLASLPLARDEGQAQEMEALLREYLLAHEPADRAASYSAEELVDLLAMF